MICRICKLSETANQQVIKIKALQDKAFGLSNLDFFYLQEI
jgi:hypothetical protein